MDVMGFDIDKTPPFHCTVEAYFSLSDLYFHILVLRVVLRFISYPIYILVVQNLTKNSG